MLTLFRSLNVASWFAIAALLALVQSKGERVGTLGALLYLPAAVWWLPLVPLIGLSAIFDRRLLWGHLALALYVGFGYSGFNWSHWGEAPAQSITCLTNNVGQSNKQSLLPFLQRENPDIVALQDCGVRARDAYKALPGYQIAAKGEFVLLSKMPVLSVGPVKALDRLVAVRFELDARGRRLVVYNVHLPSPRSELTRAKGVGLLAEILDPASVSHPRRSLGESMRRRVSLAEALVRQIEAEKERVLILGDLNAPSQGYVYQLFASRFRDAFNERGRGYGFTFPGVTRNPLSFFGPWLRLDYIFSSAELRPVYCRTESERQSQHRAVVARFEWPGKS